MKAALYNGTGEMEIVDFPRPEVGPGDALISVANSGVCGSDLLVYASTNEPETLPAGHEISGEVVDVGDGVERSLVGKRVAIDTVGQGRGCGSCWYCRMGQQVLCERPGLKQGGFAEFIKRRSTGCYELPDTLTWEDGALVEPLAVSVHAMRRGSISGGETVLILGAGTIGLTAVAAARAMGAGRVIVSAKYDSQMQMARTLGADEILSSEADDLGENILGLTGGRGADLTIECVGGFTNTTLTQAVEFTRPQGRIVVTGGFRTPMTLGGFAGEWLAPLSKELSVIFSSCYSILDGRHDYEIAIDLMRTQIVDLRKLVTHRFPFQDIQVAFDTAADKSTGSIKVQVSVSA